MTNRVKKVVFILMVAMIGALAVGHITTPGYMLFYHDTYRRLSYFPIVIGAILYGVRGGLGMAVLSCLGFVPHLYTFWAEGPEAYYSELSEIFFYLAAGLVIGLISSKENRLKKKYQDLSEKLKLSYERLAGQAAQLVAAEKQLGESRKLSMLGHVSASFAHEIKNPLASIKGAAEILADEVNPDHPKYEFVGIMRSEISRLNESVEKVLEFCRGNQPGKNFEYKPVNQVVGHVISLMDVSVQEKQIDISVAYQPETQGIEIEEAPMIQVLLNVLINAVDAVEKKGKILIEVSCPDKGILIKVSDDGAGIEADKKEMVFQSFVTSKEGGTGLGLSISKKIVESLEGDIFIADSSLGGAAVGILLPGRGSRNLSEGV